MQTHPNNHYNPLVGNILIQWIISNIPGMELKIEATISTLSYLTARCVELRCMKNRTSVGRNECDRHAPRSVLSSEPASDELVPRLLLLRIDVSG